MRELRLFAGRLRKEDELAVEATGNTRMFHEAVKGHVQRPWWWSTRASSISPPYGVGLRRGKLKTTVKRAFDEPERTN
jgi:hypothetical protein